MKQPAADYNTVILIEISRQDNSIRLALNAGTCRESIYSLRYSAYKFIVMTE